MSHNI